MLYDASGQPIYLFDAETTSRPECYGDCAKAWPPVLTKGKPRPAGAVEPDLLGTIRRRDGSTQITYAGHPLYFYAHEGKYQVLCHNVTEFGGTWLVVKPNGQPASTWPPAGPATSVIASRWGAPMSIRPHPPAPKPSLSSPEARRTA